jgi:hypothetical protein
MSTTSRPSFWRPVEVYMTSGHVFAIDASPVSYSSFAMGTYANAAGLFHSFAAYVTDTVGYDMEIALSDDLLFQMRCTSASIDVTWEDGDLGEIFGWNDDVSMTQNSWYTADRRPLYMWTPTHQVSDQTWMKTIPVEEAVGTTSQNGTWAGVTRGTSFYKRKCRFTCENSEYVLISKAAADVDYDNQEYRSAEYFFTRSLTANPVSDNSCSCQGFWYYPDVNDVISDVSLSLTEPWNEAEDIGVYFDKNTPDHKVFCHTSTNMLPQAWDGEPSFPASTLRYNFEIQFNTAPAPAFQYIDYVEAS